MTTTVAPTDYRMKNPFSLTYAIAHRFHMRVGEWSLAFAMLLAGLVLMMQDETFALSPYVVLRTMAPEETWGILLAGLGFVRMVVLVINGSLPRGSPHLRALFAMMSAIIWSVLLAGYLASHIPSLMIAMTGAAVLTEFINIFRAAGLARIEDNRGGGKGNGSSG